MNCTKIKTADELAAIIDSEKQKNKKVVLCHGIFDLLHIGHIRHFEQARQLGDILVVSITPDKYAVDCSTEFNFTELVRAEAVASLNAVDYVIISTENTAEKIIRLVRPNVYAKGADSKQAPVDQLRRLAKEKKVVYETGGKVLFTDDSAFSSTQLINQFFTQCPRETRQYLHVLQTRYSLDELIEYIEKCSILNVLVIGDIIIDDYQYCRTLGVSSKDPALAIQYESNDLFAGGVLSVANHIAGFVDTVQLFSIIGEQNSYEEFIRNQLHSNINGFFFHQDNAPTIIKRRYIEGYSLNKLFEVYIMNDSGLSEQKQKQLINSLDQQINDCDLVVVADFGHGAISAKIRNYLIDQKKFLAVNTQANAGNRGFNTISLYENAEYACIAEHELRLEARNRNDELRPVMSETAKKIGCNILCVTRGKKGCAIYDARLGHYLEVPALPHNVVDRVGAGDALLSVTSLLAALGAPSEVIGFIGNIVGGLAVEIMGNKKAVDCATLRKTITDIFTSL